MAKPFKGTMDQYKIHTTLSGEQFITGNFKGHPIFDGSFGFTSKIIKFNDDGTIETLNSIYKLGERRE